MKQEYGIPLRHSSADKHIIMWKQVTGKVVSMHHLTPGMEGIHFPFTQQSSLIHISHQIAVVSQADRCLGSGEAVDSEEKASLTNCNYLFHNFTGSRIRQRQYITLLLLTALSLAVEKIEWGNNFNMQASLTFVSQSFKETEALAMRGVFRSPSLFLNC